MTPGRLDAAKWRARKIERRSVGVGKTFLATALGHVAIRRRYSVHFERADLLLKRLRASRLDNSHDTELRKLLRADLLLLDDFCLQPMDTADIYEIVVERHRNAATVLTSNREPVEWPALMADGLLAQPAIDRLAVGGIRARARRRVRSPSPEADGHERGHLPTSGEAEVARLTAAGPGSHHADTDGG